MRTFFNYFGGKYRAAPKYPYPRRSTIVEPFAGAAGYSLRYFNRTVLLYDIDPVIAGLWDYLIHVSESEINSLPIEVAHVDELKVCQEAKWLIGFWLNPGSTAPRKQPSKWARHPLPGRLNTYWGKGVRERIRSQIGNIRHWKVFNKPYWECPEVKATWFVDPPYHQSGVGYVYHDINYAHLGSWCKDQIGQVIVCEQEGATWLPFVQFAHIKALDGSRGKKVSSEVIWVNNSN